MPACCGECGKPEILSRDNLHASYPRVRSREELQNKLRNAICRDIENIIASFHEDELRGVCVYHWDSNDNYAQTTQFLIKEKHYEEVADELVDYIRKKLSGHELLIGVPVTNENAIQYLNKINAECIDSSVDTRLYNLQPRTTKKPKGIEEVTMANIEEYSIFHDKYAIPFEMYYHSSKFEERYRTI